MQISRRGFLGSILALGAAPAIVRADSLMRIVMPTADEIALVKTSGNHLLTIDMITREALRILNKQINVWEVDQNGSFIKAHEFDVLTIRKPLPYASR